ncbi:Disease resistance protein [Corchorus capsularis]|uniref:Disease resistance protein n=1 Tax=Corchorus capsularis TaxID=210143 RepID=A0A1R3G452_COCAP|nr:Disease resistance protein [Corchorus capsularis]
MDLVSPVLDIATRLWVCGSRHLSYVLKFEKNLQSLERESAGLNNVRNDVQLMVDNAEKEPRMRRTEAVGNWLTSMGRMAIESSAVIEEGRRQLQNRCLGSRCPKDLRSTYKVGKRIVKKRDAVRDLRLAEDRIVGASGLTVRMPRMRLLMPELLVENTVGLDSTVERVWRCIQDVNVRLIRLCGIGGVGKSTLLKKLSNEFLHNQDHDFDYVIWVKVSRQEEYIDKVQEVIRKKLDISDAAWNDCSSEEEKGAQIFSFLKTKKFVLLLDDVWERFDLLRLGIHLELESDDDNRSKVIFTTRSVELFNAIRAQETIEVECLPPDQALRLFRMSVGENILNNNPELSELAEIIATKCGGLPLALLTVGRAMASRRNLGEWRHAVELLQSNPSEIEGMRSHVFPLLKFSYDSLNNATAQNCFRYCSIFPKDYDIRMYELIDLWIGEGFLDGSNPRDQADFIIGTLKLAYLLESDESTQCVRMHDIVYEMALWLARDQGKNRNKVLVTKSGKITYQELKKWEEANWISLFGSRSRVNIDYSPSCNHLSTLLFRDTLLKSFPHGFFDSMPALKVLDVSGNQGLLELPSDIGNVAKLQYLNLSSTGIAKLPASFTNLINLRCLLLDYTMSLKRISVEVISCLSLLQVYSKMNGALEYLFDAVKVPGDDEDAFLDALECLNHINKLGITIFAAPSVDKILNSYILRSCIRKLTLMDCEGLISLCFTQDLGNLERLEIFHCCSLTEFKLSEWCKLVNLHEVHIGVCPFLLNLNFLAYARNLETLTIIDCESLQEVTSEIRSFPGLKTISLTQLRNLKSMSPSPRCFPCLSEIEVSQCSLLMQLPFDSENVNFLHKIRGETEWWGGLIWNDEAIKKACRSKFVNTSSGPLQKKKDQASTSR